MITVTKLTLDVSRANAPSTVFAKQGDSANARKLRITLTSLGSAVQVTAGATAILRCHADDREVLRSTGSVNASGQIEVYLPVFEAWGSYSADILLTQNGAEISTEMFHIRVDGSGTLPGEIAAVVKDGAVQYLPQSLTEAQKKQARENIGAMSADAVIPGGGGEGGGSGLPTVNEQMNGKILMVVDGFWEIVDLPTGTQYELRTITIPASEWLDNGSVIHYIWYNDHEGEMWDFAGCGIDVSPLSTSTKEQFEAMAESGVYCYGSTGLSWSSAVCMLCRRWICPSRCGSPSPPRFPMPSTRRA